MKDDFNQAVAAAAAGVLMPAEAVQAGQPFWFQYMPPGRHDIAAKVGGKLSVRVDALACAALQADLERRLKENVIPFFDFDHDGRAASMHPRRFEYRGAEAAGGIWCEAVPTVAGAEAIAGKSHRYFSPFFAVSKDGRVVGLSPLGPNCGGLVNDPAFTRILPVAAGKDQSPDEGTTNEDNMKPNQLAVFAVLAARGLLTDTEAAADNAAETLTSRLDGMAAAAGNASDSAETLRTELAEMRRMHAETQLAAAAAAGRLPAVVGNAVAAGAAENPLRGMWLSQLSSPDRAVREQAAAALNALPVSAAMRDLPGDRQERTGDEDAQAVAAAAAQEKIHRRARALCEEARQQGRTLTWPAACAAAQREATA